MSATCRHTCGQPKGKRAFADNNSKCHQQQPATKANAAANAKRYSRNIASVQALPESCRSKLLLASCNFEESTTHTHTHTYIHIVSASSFDTMRLWSDNSLLLSLSYNALTSWTERGRGWHFSKNELCGRITGCNGAATGGGGKLVRDALPRVRRNVSTTHLKALRLHQKLTYFCWENSNNNFSYTQTASSNMVIVTWTKSAQGANEKKKAVGMYIIVVRSVACQQQPQTPLRRHHW